MMNGNCICREHEEQCGYTPVHCPNNPSCPPLLKKVCWLLHVMLWRFLHLQIYAEWKAAFGLQGCMIIYYGKGLGVSWWKRRLKKNVDEDEIENKWCCQKNEGKSINVRVKKMYMWGKKERPFYTIVKKDERKYPSSSPPQTNYGSPLTLFHLKTNGRGINKIFLWICWLNLVWETSQLWMWMMLVLKCF